MEVFGNIILDEKNNLPFDVLKRILEKPIVKPHFRLSVLTPDEQVEYVIPEEDIEQGGLNFTESYQNGQRKNISVTLINTSGRYTPHISGLWVNSRFLYEVGIEYRGSTIWFPKGIFIMGNVSLIRGNSNKTVEVQLQDKYAIFEGKTGTLETAYEVELGSNIEDAVRGVMNFAMGNGYILDYKQPIFDPSFFGMVTQQTIRVEQGDNLGSVINALATQLSAEYYYNNMGNLCFYPLNETVDDSVKPIIWTYPYMGRDLHNMNLNYDNENIINQVKVVGDNADSAIYSALVKNENPASPICIQHVGVRMDAPHNEANVWSDDLAYDLARYYLRKASFVGVSFSMNVSFNPILTVNNLCEVDDDELGFKREKLLINSISYSSGDGLMSLSCCNTADLPLNMASGVEDDKKKRSVR